MAYGNKTYELVAEGLSRSRRVIEGAYEEGTLPHAASVAAWETVVEKMADHLQATHRGAYSFKRSRFLKAAGHPDSNA